MPLNLKADTEMNASTCYSSLDYVHLAMNDPTTAVPTDSLMFSQTLHRYRTCLSNDDLEGLNYLYPTCEGAFEPQGEYLEPLCIKASRFAGWLRLGLVTSVPFFLSATFIVLVQVCILGLSPSSPPHCLASPSRSSPLSLASSLLPSSPPLPLSLASHRDSPGLFPRHAPRELPTPSQARPSTRAGTHAAIPKAISRWPDVGASPGQEAPRFHGSDHDAPARAARRPRQ